MNFPSWTIWPVFFGIPVTVAVVLIVLLRRSGVKGPQRGTWQNRALQGYGVALIGFAIWLTIRY